MKSEIEMKKTIRFLLFLIIIVLPLGCDQSGMQYYTDIQGLPKILEIGSDLCKPPCWHGIIPGQTSIKDAEVKIESLEFFSDDGYMRNDESFSELIWYGGGGNNAYFSYDDNIIQSINFYFLDGSFLDTILSNYGNPDGYILSEDDAGYVITIFYPSLGIVFHASQGYPEPISSKMTVNVGYYLPTANPELFLENYLELRQKIHTSIKIDEVDYIKWDGLNVCPKGLSLESLCDE